MNVTEKRPSSEEGDNDDLSTLVEELNDEDGQGADAAAHEEESHHDEQAGRARPVNPELLMTDIHHGLTSEEVNHRLKKFGHNQMSEEKESHIKKLLSFFKGPIQYVMWIAVILAGALEDWIDFGIIIGLLCLNAAVGFIQEYSAGNVVNELKKKLALKAVVNRDGQKIEIEAVDVVPGDVLHIEEGTIIPADGKVVSPNAFIQVDQSALTGESLAVNKTTGDECFASSNVKRGEGLIVITATGDSTFVGRAAALVNAGGNGTGHFTKVINSIGTTLLFCVLVTLLAVWIACFYRNTGIVQGFKYTLAITIIGVPVGLPAVVTTTMAVGAMFLAKKQAIVQKLSAIESLAGVEILCSDKTGTLTANKLTLAEPYCVDGVDPDDLVLTACLAASRKKKGLEPIDRAFLKSLKIYKRARAELPTFTTLSFQPFDPVSKKVTAEVMSADGERIVCVKGSPIPVLRTVAEDSPVPDHVERAYNEKVDEFASRGFRSLGIARKRAAGWEILGIMPLHDPPRFDTAQTVNEAQALGINIKMLTGDAVGIAKETARQLALGTNIYNADRLGVSGSGDMPGSTVHDFVEAADGFAEVFPEHKYDVVDKLQARGHLVAMTGDGVNDAPSLKKADTGIAVEGAADAARSAADIVFLAPGLSAIIDAIKTSRQIFHRMHAYIVYRIALSLHLEIFLGLWIVILNQSINIILVVFLAIFADIATLMIAYDNAPFSRIPDKWNLPKLWGMAVLLGIVLAIGSWLTLTMMLPYHTKGEMYRGGIVENYGHRDAVLFLQIALTENWLIFVTRTKGAPWSSCPSWKLVSAIVAVDLCATLFCRYGIFLDGQKTSWLTIANVYIFSFGIFCVMALVYWGISGSQSFDNMMHGKSVKTNKKNREKEDFVTALQRVSTMHEKTETKSKAH
ncbi:plasma-membrane proton-e [Polychaeton citri CBS 116435]|uniref:Plasma membrane ATPase n=1 Tax=Polychaeton citri CBS 116435 TaxID=1314669 RepID=A0A9P4UN21_9PEZI|nr:plasma-membrane proton-e [Polychaeton citri CBS 116435]